ncbi:transposase family protein [Synechococcus sp. PCC 6312]|uniref:HARBI1 family protein n=1 Tax=Synechococcus sp. (strain ATCC 27167 / PCC 6312) TaxID=195253 RepID=UPI0009005300|nr:transposase family protein [Synechococcus sp. PCC 6312]
MIDSTEQVIERPSSYQEQKRTYSGKRKNFTLKNQLIVSPVTLDIIDVVVGMPGRISDISIWRNSRTRFTLEQFFMGDKAYVGERQIKTPTKKPKNGELTRQEKEDNKSFSARRIIVEHLIRFVKIFRIMQERFRLPISRYDSIFLTVCGLVRLRLGCLELRLVKH